MTIFHKKGFIPDKAIIIAQNALSAFLKQPATAISCELLAGGYRQDSIVKCTYLATSYVIKCFSSSQLGKNEIAWTEHACNLSIGPKLYYADPAGNYMIIEFCHGNSLVPVTANIPGVIKNIATNLSQLHHSCAPFAQTSDMFKRIDAKYKKLDCSGKLKNLLENCMQQVKNIKTQLQNMMVPPVPCHNDLNPGNAFANNNKVILIDWGDAALDNPYYDIAAFFVLNVIKSENEKLFFEQYDSKLLTPLLQNYMQLYKQLIYFEFPLNLLLGVQANKSELLHAQYLPQINHLNHYLTLLAEQKAEINSDFLYNMAIASLSEITY